MAGSKVLPTFLGFAHLLVGFPASGPSGRCHMGLPGLFFLWGLLCSSSAVW